MDAHFGHLGKGGFACVLGSKIHSPRWHVYVADAAYVAGFNPQAPAAPPAHTFTVEVRVRSFPLPPLCLRRGVWGPSLSLAAACR